MNIQFTTYASVCKLALVDGKICRILPDDVDKLPEGSVVFKEGDKVELQVIPQDFPQEIMDQVNVPVYYDGYLSNVFWTFPIWSPSDNRKAV